MNSGPFTVAAGRRESLTMPLLCPHRALVCAAASAASAAVAASGGSAAAAAAAGASAAASVAAGAASAAAAAAGKRSERGCCNMRMDPEYMVQYPACTCGQG